MIFSNNGERCTAGCRILVQQSIYADFAREVRRARAAHHGRRPAGREDHHRPDDQSQGHLAKVRRYIELGPEGRRRRCCAAGSMRRRCRRALRKGNYVMPTVFADVDNRMQIAQDEIFGPVACLIPFDDEADAIAHRQRHPVRPVAATSGPRTSAARTAWPRRSRPACASSTARTCATCASRSAAPRPSGTGREGGTWSYEVFLEPKNVAVSLGSHHIPHWGV